METVAVVGLGYVGLPLAIAFGKKMPTIGYDLSAQKIAAYQEGHDPTGEVPKLAFQEAKLIHFTTESNKLSSADAIVVAVPTPVDKVRKPDFGPLVRASTLVGQAMKSGTTVIYESTVYPGATEEICIPVLEKNSGLIWKKDFFVGYSPERVNPGDKNHTVEHIAKLVSGDTPETLEKVAALYSKIITAGVYQVRSIQIAEAAKVIENTQRDLNIALINELALIFHKIGIDTLEVLEAAGTKWNFLPFRPGLVGGHCIGVDPYYLTHKAEMLNYHPEVILAGRRINDSMGKFIAEQTIKQMIAAGHSVLGARVNILGLTFKENCGDIRNSKVVDIITELKSFGVEVFVHDPLVDTETASHAYGLSLQSWEALQPSEALIVAVPHEQFKVYSTSDYLRLLKPHGCLIDVKSILDQAAFYQEGIAVWRL